MPSTVRPASEVGSSVPSSNSLLHKFGDWASVTARHPTPLQTSTTVLMGRASSCFHPQATERDGAWPFGLKEPEALSRNDDLAFVTSAAHVARRMQQLWYRSTQPHRLREVRRRHVNSDIEAMTWLLTFDSGVQAVWESGIMREVVGTQAPSLKDSAWYQPCHRQASALCWLIHRDDVADVSAHVVGLFAGETRLSSQLVYFLHPSWLTSELQSLGVMIGGTLTVLNPRASVANLRHPPLQPGRAPDGAWPAQAVLDLRALDFFMNCHGRDEWASVSVGGQEETGMGHPDTPHRQRVQPMFHGFASALAPTLDTSAAAKETWHALVSSCRQLHRGLGQWLSRVTVDRPCGLESIPGLVLMALNARDTNSDTHSAPTAFVGTGGSLNPAHTTGIQSDGHIGRVSDSSSAVHLLQHATSNGAPQCVTLGVSCSATVPGVEDWAIWPSPHSLGWSVLELRAKLLLRLYDEGAGSD